MGRLTGIPDIGGDICEEIDGGILDAMKEEFDDQRMRSMNNLRDS